MNYQLAFDLEAQKLDTDLGGWANVHHAFVSIACGIKTFKDGSKEKIVYSDEPQEYFKKAGVEWDVRPVVDLVKDIKNASHVISWNGREYDYKVLLPYDHDGVIYPKGCTNPAVKNQTDFINSKTVDMRAVTRKVTGGRGKLDGAGKATLGRGKSQGAYGGLKAVEWWKEYLASKVASGDDFSSMHDECEPKIHLLKFITDYCMDDTDMTDLIFWFGIKHGYILVDIAKEDEPSDIRRITATWRNYG